MSKETTGQVFGLMDNLLEKIRAEKRASQKRATDGSEPTTHPVMNAPDGTQPAREGARSAENEGDVEKDYGVLGNTGQEDANSATSANAADSIGTQSQASDVVKGNVAKPKAVKDAPDESAGRRRQTIHLMIKCSYVDFSVGNRRRTRSVIICVITPKKSTSQSIKTIHFIII